jgi:hypothetical protein
VDVLEHVTDGGVHVDAELLGDYSREAMLGGAVTAESGSETHYLASERDPDQFAPGRGDGKVK